MIGQKSPAGRDFDRLPIYVLTGPTGAGKTDWAVALAEAAPVEIVSVDSAQVYRGMDIGTAKPSRAMRERIPHHLIDICEPTESYSAGQFVADALVCIRAIHARGRVPLLTGGTMLYLRALLHGLAPMPTADAAVRADLDRRAAGSDWPALHRELAGVDPEAAARIAPTDSQRIQRALEVYYSSGRPISQWQRETVSPLGNWTVRAWVVNPPDRAVLHQRLAQRFMTMMQQGFLEEVRGLHSREGLTARHASMRAVGYRQLWAHLSGECTLEEAVQRGIAATRQLAKRQLTWLRREPFGPWLDPAQGNLSWINDICHELAQLGI